MWSTKLFIHFSGILTAFLECGANPFVDSLDILEFHLFDYENYCLIINANIDYWWVIFYHQADARKCSKKTVRPRVVFCLSSGEFYLTTKFIEHCCPNVVYNNNYWSGDVCDIVQIKWNVKSNLTEGTRKCICIRKIRVRWRLQV